MQLGFCMHTCREQPLRDLLPKLAAWGYQAVELSAWPHHSCHPARLKADARQSIRTALTQYDLQLSAVSAHTQWVGVHEIVTERALDYTKRCIELAAELGAPIVTTNSGAYPMAGERHTSWERLLDGLSAAAQYAAEQGVLLALEPHIDHIVLTWESARNVMRLVDSSHLRINFDASHWHVTGFDDTVALEHLFPYIVHVHLRDHVFHRMPLADGRYENEAEPCAIGDGVYDLEAHLRRLEALGYDGVLSVELSALDLDVAAERSAQAVLALL